MLTASHQRGTYHVDCGGSGGLDPNGSSLALIGISDVHVHLTGVSVVRIRQDFISTLNELR